MQKMIPLKDLRFGEEHKPPLNVRKTGREIGIEELATSIDANGMGQALNIVEQAGLAFVEDGNRRLRALHLLKKKGNLTDGALIKCEISDKQGLKTGELGLALNTQRVAMHPADIYEAVKDQQKQGRTEEEIVSRTGWALKTVRQMLAMGALATIILDDWRADRLGGNPVEVVRALTLAPNLKDQEAVYKRLKKASSLYPQDIRAAFGRGGQQVMALLAFVGREAYEKAGGRIIEDLFQERQLVSDQELLNTVAVEKLKAKLKSLTDEGWAWASDVDDLPNNWGYSWQKVKGGKKAKPEDKAKSGCAVEVKDDGSVVVTYGVVRPKPVAAPTTSTSQPAAPKKDEPARLSGALESSLREMAYKATHDALKAEAPATPLAGILAGIVGRQINFRQTYHTPSPVSDQMKAIRDAISPVVMDAALQKAFDADRYFKGAPKEFVLRAIRESVNPEQAKKLSAGTKAAAWKFALDNVPKTGWLPPELRTAHYSGPGAAKPKPTKAVVKKPAKAPLKKAA
jgi:ParB family chromosome partitioning protein